jgi:hypothetical protein
MNINSYGIFNLKGLYNTFSYPAYGLIHYTIYLLICRTVQSVAMATAHGLRQIQTYIGSR